MGNSKELEVKNEEVSLQSVSPTSIEKLISQAIEKGTGMETVERLVSLLKELKADWAKSQFDVAMSDFQAKCPIIEKTKKIDFTSQRTGARTQYSYAPLDVIVKQTKDLIAECGLSYTIQTENTDKVLVSIVKVRHISGHSEETRFEVPIDLGAKMGAQQQYGAASTFGKRYAFCNAFGILTGDEDNDASSTPEPHQTQKTTPNSPKSSKQCPECKKWHNGDYMTCYECWKIKNGRAKPPQKTDKQKIADLCITLDTSLSTKEDYEKFVEDSTGMKLEEANYKNIIDKLTDLKTNIDIVEGELVTEPIAPKEESQSAKLMREAKEKAQKGEVH